MQNPVSKVSLWKPPPAEAAQKKENDEKESLRQQSKPGDQNSMSLICQKQNQNNLIQKLVLLKVISN